MRDCYYEHLSRLWPRLEEIDLLEEADQIKEILNEDHRCINCGKLKLRDCEECPK